MIFALIQVYKYLYCEAKSTMLPFQPLRSPVSTQLSHVSVQGYNLGPVATGFRIPRSSISLTMLATMRSQPRAATRLIVTGVYSIFPLFVLLYGTSPTIGEQLLASWAHCPILEITYLELLDPERLQIRRCCCRSFPSKELMGRCSILSAPKHILSPNILTYREYSSRYLIDP
jgi:hypothetical protein